MAELRKRNVPSDATDDIDLADPSCAVPDPVVVDEDSSGVESDSEIEPSESEKKEPESQEGDGIINGKRFIVPQTRPPMPSLDPRLWGLDDIIQMSSGLNLLLFFLPFPKWFYICLFIFWRLAYDLGLGLLLEYQSKYQILTKFIESIPKNSPLEALAKKLASAGLGSDYDYDKSPAALNAWLVYRKIVDMVLPNDLVTYFLFCLVYFEVPEEINFTLLGCYLLGIFLCGFTVWAKMDAYRVVKDFAWYWGDFFFLLDKKLTFDRVFAITPHPMYTIGYAFYYGASLITQSYTVLYVSLFAHFCQLLFLSLVEDPHIEKTYSSFLENPDPEKQKVLSGYFRKDLIVFKNFNIFRASDIAMVVVLAYTAVLFFLDVDRIFYLMQAVVWRCIHNFGLGYVLHQQSTSKMWTKLAGTKQEAFDNWKRIYNLSLTMTHVAFVCCALKYSGPMDLQDGKWLLKLTAGAVLIALNGWSSMSAFAVLGEFGWFYGDFFIDEVPSTLYYTGIYRFLNNPDNVTGFAGYYGLALMSDSWVIYALALFSQFCNMMFSFFVEKPHMKKLYGDKLRQDSGLEMAIRDIVKETISDSPRLSKLSKDVENQVKKVKQSTWKIRNKVKTQSDKLRLTMRERALHMGESMRAKRLKVVLEAERLKASATKLRNQATQLMKDLATSLTRANTPRIAADQQ